MKIGERFTYYALSLFGNALAWLPLRALYLLSDILAWLAHSVVKYRVKVVRQNLASSFPEKSEQELREIERRFYHFLTDYFVETVKLLHADDKFMRRRLKVDGIEQINAAVRADRSCVLYLGHLCNWEWVSSLPLVIDPKASCCQIYHHLNNRGSDKFFYKLRTRFGAHNIEMEDTLRALVGFRREGRPTVTGFIADQAPMLNVHLWLDFLHHETGVFTGPERIARMLDAEVFYGHLTRPRRGYYTLKIVPITSDIKSMEQFEPTREYFRLLEQNIRECPPYWLWSHRRWKRTRAMFNEYYGPNADRRLTHL